MLLKSRNLEQEGILGDKNIDKDGPYQRMQTDMLINIA